jgi:hypothetical protein
MRGRIDPQMTIVVVDAEELIPEQHLIRRVQFVDGALSRLEPTFDESTPMWAGPSPPNCVSPAADGVLTIRYPGSLMKGPEVYGCVATHKRSQEPRPNRQKRLQEQWSL